MTPAEKAEMLYRKIEDSMYLAQYTSDAAKQCALIAVDEIIKAHIHNEGVRHLKWWEEVKREIEKVARSKK